VEPVTLAEVFSGVREAIWSEARAAQNVNSFRRNLQRRHLDILARILVSPAPGVPEDARTLARADLADILKDVGATLKSPAARLDRITRAHLEETKGRIEATLDAKVERELFPRLTLTVGG